MQVIFPVLFIMAGKAKLTLGIAHFQQMFHSVSVMDIMAAGTFKPVIEEHILFNGSAET
jgi:hypothetical protein